MNLLHITDTGAASGNGTDTTVRLIKQYQRLGENVHIIPAGNSPLHIAFTGCSLLHPNAGANATKAALLLGRENIRRPVIALNCAPRNHTENQPAAKEKHIYRVKTPYAIYLIYGPQVAQWVAEFCGTEDTQIEEILSLGDIVPDTSSGSQFRSAEHLPIAHALQVHKKLDAVAKRTTLALEPIFKGEDTATIAPPDEYQNGRLLVTKTLADAIAGKTHAHITDVSPIEFAVRESLTDVNPGELSIWPSSNHFANPNICVLNIGTRWQPGTTRTTDMRVQELAEKCSLMVGCTEKIEVS